VILSVDPLPETARRLGGVLSQSDAVVLLEFIGSNFVSENPQSDTNNRLGESNDFWDLANGHGNRPYVASTF
jgi:hypothetical protein